MITIKKPIKVWSRKAAGEAQVVGIAPGNTRLCQLEGCGHDRLYVRWPNGQVSWPCLDGMKERKGGYEIK